MKIAPSYARPDASTTFFAAALTFRDRHPLGDGAAVAADFRLCGHATLRLSDPTAFSSAVRFGQSLGAQTDVNAVQTDGGAFRSSPVKDGAAQLTWLEYWKKNCR